MEYSKDLFEQKLIEFFDRHDPTKKHLVPKIRDKFIDNQETIFKHLTELYTRDSEARDYDISDDAIFSVPAGPNAGDEPY